MKLIYSLICFALMTPLWAQNIVIVEDDDVGTGVTNWTADNEYHLNGYVFVEEGGALHIEAGTVIKGLATPSTGDNASALIIARGAQVFAEGTPGSPIIFTAEFDDVEVPDDLTKNDKGLWGGLIILGNGVVGVDGGVTNIEGIPSIEGRGEYGGDDNNDNSGVMKYISIRHGGAKLEANNEINGLTLGGVGRGTTIDYIEVFANLDDGIEWFGGAVEVKHASVAFCGDDSYDWDQSWDGKGQFWFSLQDEVSNRGGEWDGSEASDLMPKVNPTFSNLTFIGAGSESVNEDGNDALRIRDDAAAHVYNSIFADFADQAIIIDNDNVEDSWQRFLDGDISFVNNVFNDIHGGGSLETIFDVDGGDSDMFLTHLTNNTNSYADPGIANICRTPGECLDPRISTSGAAHNNGVSVGDAFFEDVDYIGAFDNDNNWLLGWTALDANNFLGDFLAVDDPALSELDKSMRVYPNPVSDNLYIEFELNTAGEVGVTVINMQGQRVFGAHSNTNFGGGFHKLELHTGSLQPGMYIVALIQDGSIMGRRVIVKK